MLSFERIRMTKTLELLIVKNTVNAIKWELFLYFFFVSRLWLTRHPFQNITFVFTWFKARNNSTMQLYFLYDNYSVNGKRYSSRPYSSRAGNEVRLHDSSWLKLDFSSNKPKTYAACLVVSAFKSQIGWVSARQDGNPAHCSQPVSEIAVSLTGVIRTNREHE